MRAWWVDEPHEDVRRALAFGERADPVPGRGEIRLRVMACGVCRTDLHLTVGELPPHRRGVVPGHEVVGHVDAVGDGVTEFAVGDRAGIAWLHRACGRCVFCRRGDENLCEQPTFTGWDVDGGYAELAVADERFAYHLPDAIDAVDAAPLLCAGIIGYRAVRAAACRPGGALGIYGFGAAGHLAAQVALHEGHRVHVLTRSRAAQRLALELGATSAGDAAEAPPEPLDAAVLFAPAGTLVPPALAALAPGGTLAVAGIYLSDIPVLSYEQHLFRERTLRSVTANTRRDGDEFLRIAAQIGLTPTTTAYAFDRADQALVDLAGDRVNGAAVLVVDG